MSNTSIELIKTKLLHTLLEFVFELDILLFSFELEKADQIFLALVSAILVDS